MDILIKRENNKNIDEKFHNNKKSDYIKVWNSNLFLHDENNPKLLSEAFIMSDACYKHILDKIPFEHQEELADVIKHFINYNKSSCLLLTGKPGIGKTSLVAWMANEYKDNERIIILRFRDWDREELEGGLLKAIYNILRCKKRDLENKILILDGFDEIKVLDRREKLIVKFMTDLKDFNNFKCIITSRPDYIDSYYFYTWLEIAEFNLEKIELFYKNITGKDLDYKEKVRPNLEVIGIPVILYMAIMTKVDIASNPTKPELYDCIFAEKGGIFDKFYDGKNEYSEGSQILRNPENIKTYLNFLRNIAFTMFKLNSLSLPKESYQIPQLEYEGNYVSILDFPIKHLFENSRSAIEFIHTSIYEYFVSEYIFKLIKENIEKPKEILTEILGGICIFRMISKEILEFLKYKIRTSELSEKYSTISQIFHSMIRSRMTNTTKTHYANILDCELNVFCNMLEIIHLWNNNILYLDSSVAKYICYNQGAKINLENAKIENAYLSNANLENANLKNVKLQSAYFMYGKLVRADLSYSNLYKTDFRFANLMGAKLEEAYLSYADLTNVVMCKAVLRKVKLIGTNLKEADLREADLTDAKMLETDLRDANLGGAKLTGADLNNVNLNNADLRGADLSNIKFKNVNLVGAILKGANLYNINLNGVNLANTVFDENQIEELKSKCNLNEVRVYLYNERKLVSYQDYKEYKSAYNME